MTFECDKTIKSARKAHVCEQCHKLIEIGSEYTKRVGVYDGDFYRTALHPDCDEATTAYAKLHDLWDDDWPWLYEGEFEEPDRAWMREHYPAVAERLGWVKPEPDAP